MEQEELRQRFNPEGSILRKQQDIMLHILDSIDTICKKNDIKYWLCSGTLLGAVRHGGFIPWDDDLDIEMLEDDYNKFLSIIQKDGLPEELILQTKEIDNNYTLPFAKIRHTKSVILEEGKKSQTKGFDGIFIDIFPLVKTNRHISKFAFNLSRIYYKICAMPQGKIQHFFENSLYISLYKILYPFLSKLVNKFSKKDEYGVRLGIPFRYRPRRLKDIYPLGEILFEGKKFPSPNNVDAYLSKVYGNYKTMPDLDKIKVHISKIEIYE